MKFVIVFAALFALANAGLITHSGQAELLRSDTDVGPESHRYFVETSDGVKLESQGHLENAGTDHESYSHQGSYSYVADDGQTYSVTYIADENGYQPQGAHLPVGPVAIHH